MGSEPKRTSFPTQWVILGLALAALAAAAGLHLSLEHERVERREQERLLAQSRVVQENIGANLTAVDRVLEDVRADLPRHLAWHGVDPDLKTLTDAMPGVRTLAILDGRGDVLASSRPELLDKNFAFREYFQAPRRNPDPEMLFVSPPFKTTLDVYGVALSRPLPAANGKFAGVIVATLDPEYFRTLMASVLYASDMWTAIAHGDGIQLMMEPDREGQAGKNLAQPGSFFVRHRDSGKDVTVMTGTVYATGEERMMALRSIRLTGQKQDKPLVVAAGRDLDAIYEGWRRDVRVESAIVLLIALIAAALLSVHQRRYGELMRKEAEAAAALSDSERFMRVLTDNLPGMIGYWTAELRCRFANKAYLEWFGKTPEQMRGIRIQDLLGGELFGKNEPYIRAALKGERQHFERTLAKVDGTAGYTWANYIPDMDGEHVKGFYVLVTDVTELKQVQVALAQSERKLKAIIEAEPECVKLVAPDGALLQMNRAGLQMIEADSEEQVVGRSVAELVAPEFRAAFAAFTERVCAGESGSLEFELVGLKGTRRWADMRAVPMHDADGRVTEILSVTRDVTARKKAERELEMLAQTDFLTGLANRRHFLVLAEQELSRSLRYGGPLSVFMMDIDHFKVVNDTHGHQVGDLVLQTLGSVCRQTLRDIDIVGRLGGEEFGIVLPQTDHRHAMEAAERLRNAVADAEVALEHGLPLHCTASIGVATLAAPGTNIDTLLSQADAALYRAKNEGRNCVRGYGEAAVSAPPGATTT